MSLTLGELPFGGVDTSAFNAGQVQLAGSVSLAGEQWPGSWLSSCFIMTHTCSYQVVWGLLLLDQKGWSLGLFALGWQVVGLCSALHLKPSW